MHKVSMSILELPMGQSSRDINCASFSYGLKSGLRSLISVHVLRLTSIGMLPRVDAVVLGLFCRQSSNLSHSPLIMIDTIHYLLL